MTDPRPPIRLVEASGGDDVHAARAYAAAHRLPPPPAVPVGILDDVVRPSPFAYLLLLAIAMWIITVAIAAAVYACLRGLFG